MKGRSRRSAQGSISHGLEAALELAASVATDSDIQRVQIVDSENNKREIELPTSAIHLLAEILYVLAGGRDSKTTRATGVLTTQQAANLLNMSRPHLVKLLERGELRHYMIGKHRRVRLAEVVQYRARREAMSR